MVKRAWPLGHSSLVKRLNSLKTPLNHNEILLLPASPSSHAPLRTISILSTTYSTAPVHFPLLHSGNQARRLEYCGALILELDA